MANRQYIGARYVPKLMGEWNADASYEALSIVQYLNGSYTSKKAVPAGVPISNTEYWVQTGQYNAQMEEYRQEVNAVMEQVNSINSRLDDDDSKIANNATPLKDIAGKNIAIFGDSISDENITWSNKVNNVWVKHFRTFVESTGGTVTNYAKSGMAFTIATDGKTIADAINNANLDNIDTVIIFGGVNDYLNDAKIGVYYSNTETELWGALNSIRDLRSKNVYVITPMNTDSRGSANLYATLAKYRKVIGAWAEYCGYSIINGNEISGFDGSHLLDDGLHPSNEYTKIISDYIISKIIAKGSELNPGCEWRQINNAPATNVSDCRVVTFVDGPDLVFTVRGTITGDNPVVPLGECGMYATPDIIMYAGNTVCKGILYQDGLSIKGANSGTFNVSFRLHSAVLNKVKLIT